MKIVVVNNHYLQRGGESAVFEAEVELLRDGGHDVMEYEDHNDRIRGMGRPSLALGTVWARSHYSAMRRLLADERPDIVHFHNFFPLISPAAHYACARQGVPVVQTLHNYRLLCPSADFFRNGRPCELCLNRVPIPGVRHACYRGSHLQSGVVAGMLVAHRLARTWSRVVDAYIALSEFSKGKFLEGGLPPDRMFVKPNFIRAVLEPRQGPGKYALYVGRLSGEKGIGTLLKAAPMVPDIPVRVVGDGPLQGEVEVASRGSMGRVIAEGRLPRSQVLELLRNARYLVVPSTCYENFPVVLVEAFASGVPVVAAGIGALQEIVDEPRTGLTFTPGDADALAAAMRRSWDRVDENLRMGREARGEYLEKYTPEANLASLLDIYGDAKARSAGKRA